MCGFVEGNCFVPPQTLLPDFNHGNLSNDESQESEIVGEPSGCDLLIIINGRLFKFKESLFGTRCPMRIVNIKYYIREDRKVLKICMRSLSRNPTVSV